MNWFNQSSHHKSILIFGGIVIAALAFEYLRKGQVKSTNIIWGAVIGAAAVEAIKHYSVTKGGAP